LSGYIASRTAAMADVIPDGVIGWLVPRGDPSTPAATLIALLSDRARADALGEQGARHVEAFDAPQVATRFIETITPMP